MKTYFWGVVAVLLMISLAVVARNWTWHHRRADIRWERIHARQERPEHKNWRERRQERRHPTPEPEPAQWLEYDLEIKAADTEPAETQPEEGRMGTIAAIVGWGAVGIGVLMLLALGAKWVLPMLPFGKTGAATSVTAVATAGLDQGAVWTSYVALKTIRELDSVEADPRALEACDYLWTVIAKWKRPAATATVNGVPVPVTTTVTPPPAA